MSAIETITITCDDDICGSGDCTGLNIPATFRSWQEAVETAIGRDYPQADIEWNVSHNTTGVSTSVMVNAHQPEDDDAVDLDTIEADILATIASVWPSGFAVVPLNDEP